MTESTKVWLMPILLVMVVLPDIQASNCRYCNKKEIEEKRFLLEKECAKKEGRLAIVDPLCCQETCSKFPGEWCGSDWIASQFCGPALYCRNNATKKPKMLNDNNNNNNNNKCVPGYKLHSGLSFCPSPDVPVTSKSICRAIAGYTKSNFTSTVYSNMPLLPAGCWKLPNGIVIFNTKSETIRMNSPTMVKISGADLICLKILPKDDLDHFNWKFKLPKLNSKKSD